MGIVYNEQNTDLNQPLRQISGTLVDYTFLISGFIKSGYLRVPDEGISVLNSNFISLRFFFHIGYHGINYRGWQWQPGIVSVQSVLESTLSQILKTKVTAIGCGRTDAMVHASQYFFHIEVQNAWDFDLLFRLNKNLPPDIAIFEIIPVKENQHARFDANLLKNPDLEKMKQAVALLPAYSDYRGFCKTPADYEHTICNVSSARLFADISGDKLRFQISANRFLGRMIRIIVGKLIEIGEGSLSVAEFEHYLRDRVTPRLIEPAYPQGLYLSKVVYPYLDIPPRTKFSELVFKDASQWVEV
jgi:tRNA pseudouridine38-40 synthase